MSNLLRGAWILPLLAGCSTPGADVEAGRETGACIEDACFDGLACLSDVCVASDDDDDDDDGPNPMTTAGSASTTGPSDESGGSSTPGPSDSGEPNDDSSDEGPPAQCDRPPHEACDGSADHRRKESPAIRPRQALNPYAAFPMSPKYAGFGGRAMPAASGAARIRRVDARRTRM